jgi:predicted site-specific integrase-resolvase
VVHPDEEQTPEQELAEDLLAIIASFAGRMSGLSSRKQKALRACAKQVLTEQEE